MKIFIKSNGYQYYLIKLKYFSGNKEYSGDLRDETMSDKNWTLVIIIG